MWHYLLPVMAAIPCFAIYTHVASKQSFDGIKPISLYGLAFLGNLVSIAQPAALAYRSSTLYGASEQAIGGATAIASLSIASIIGPQVSLYSWTIDLSLPLTDLPHTGQAMVPTRFLCGMCHFGMHLDWLRKLAIVASVGGTQTQKKVRARNALESSRRCAACPNLCCCSS